jgi:hypothetical protein
VLSLGDDLLTAGVSAAAALLGALIGARATRRASTDAFDRAGQREDEAWRTALHQECLQNIHLHQENPGSVLLLDTRVLRDSTAHAAAFPSEILQRIIWARTANEQFEAVVRAQRENPTNLVDPVASATIALDARAKVVGELSEIEKQLRPSPPPPPEQHREPAVNADGGTEDSVQRP